MKKFIAGVLVGVLLVSTAFAASYVAESATFKVFVNGKEFTSNPSALVVEGRTYLPLRAIGEALGVPVNWNAELNQAEVGITPTPSTNYSRMNPAPINVAQAYTYTNGYNDEDNCTLSIKILEIIRGEESIKKARKSYSTDDKPKDGFELMMVKASIEVVSLYGDKAYEASNYAFTSFTSNNEETERAYLHLASEEGFDWLDGKLYEGGKTEGWFVVQVKKDDLNPKIAYGLKYDGTGGAWFALY